jgi:hypothetical protein
MGSLRAEKIVSQKGRKNAAEKMWHAGAFNFTPLTLLFFLAPAPPDPLQKPQREPKNSDKPTIVIGFD